MNKTVNLEIKGQLAKLLATEDLIIENKQVETAMFNVETRVLTLPMWDAEESVYDMLVAHEVGHALFTPNRDPSKKFPQAFINVTEDARIEKLMKRKYEGLPKTFYGGYNQLYKDDFFDLKGVNIDDMNIADRINIHFKIGPFMGIKFNEEEQKIVDLTADAETFEDAEYAAEMMYNYCKAEYDKQKEEDAKEEEEFEEFMKMAGNNGEGDDLNEDVFESYNESNMEEDEGDGESTKDGRPDLGEDDIPYDEIGRDVAGNEASGPPEGEPDEPQVRTGSSIMPQKKNPDGAELVRGKASGIISNLNGLLVILKGLPLAYSKDLQDDKKIVFSAFDDVCLTLEVMTEIWSKISFNKNIMADAVNNSNATATDFANWLVQHLELSFREAYQLTGKIVAHANKNSKKLDQLNLKELQKFNKKINKDAQKTLSIDESIQNKKSFGGTSPQRVKQSIKYAIKKYL